MVCLGLERRGKGEEAKWSMKDESFTYKTRCGGHADVSKGSQNTPSSPLGVHPIQDLIDWDGECKCKAFSTSVHESRARYRATRAAACLIRTSTEWRGHCVQGYD